MTADLICPGWTAGPVLLSADRRVLAADHPLRCRLHDPEGAIPRFYVFLMLTRRRCWAPLGVNAVTLYLFYELTTLLSFPLVLHTQRPKALLGAVKYLYYSVCGGFIALFGVVLLFNNPPVPVRGGYFQTLSPALLAASFLMLWASAPGGSAAPCTAGASSQPVADRPMLCSRHHRQGGGHRRHPGYLLHRGRGGPARIPGLNNIIS